MNDGGFAPGMALDVGGGVMADRDYACGASHQIAGVRIRIPACRTEREKLRGVREINDAAGRGMMRFAQQPVAEVFGRDQHPVGLEFAESGGGVRGLAAIARRWNRLECLRARRVSTPSRCPMVFQWRFSFAICSRLPAFSGSAAATTRQACPAAAMFSSQSRLLRVAPPRGGT